MKKPFKKLGFFSLVTSSVLLGSMNATDLQTYAALQKPSHVFGNYAEKEKEKIKEKVPVSSKNSDNTDGKKGEEKNKNDTQTPQQQAQTTATTDSKEAKTLESTAKTDSTTATTDKTYESSTDTAVAKAAQQVVTDETAVQNAEKALEKPNGTTEENLQNLQKAEDKLTQDQGTLETDLQIQKLGEGLTKGIGYLKGLDAKLEKVEVSAMNTTLSGVTTISQQTSTISNLLSENVQNLSNLISNAQGLSDAFSTLASTQNTLKGYLDSSSATIGQLTNGSNAVVGALDKAINQVDMALADLVTTDTQKTQAVTLAATGSSTTTDAITFLNALKTNLTAQKDAFMNVHKNIQTAVAQAQATYKPSVMNTNNYGQMYGVDAMAGYKWFFGKTKRFGFRTYGYYSYNHANLSFVGSKLGIMDGASQVNNFTYGVGFDALYNFYESKDGYNTAGLFLGFGLGGDSFIVQGESYLKSQMQICNNTAGCSASMNTSYFQMPVEFGFRSNFSKHSGIEVGFKLPLFTNQFYKERGVDGSVDVFYKRNFSIYFNYMINF